MHRFGGLCKNPLNEIEEEAEKYKENEEGYRKLLMVVEQISNEVSAKCWIEWRMESAMLILNEVYGKMKSAPSLEQRKAEQEAKEHEEVVKRAALVEATIRPENVTSELVAEIKVSGKEVIVSLPSRNDTFVEIVRSLSYTFADNQWARTINKFAGVPTDRTVELGHIRGRPRIRVKFYHKAICYIHSGILDLKPRYAKNRI